MSNPFTLAACLPTLTDVLARPLTPISTSRRKVVSGCRPMDVLVATKFHIPRAGSVPRPRLVAGLAQGIGRGVTVVCGPAGCGKSTLLGDWARRCRWPGAGGPASVLLGDRRRPQWEAVAAAVINELAVVPDAGAVVLVLDDYHLIEAPAVPTRRCRWRGCGPGDSWASCAPTTCGSRPARRQCSCGRPPGWTCRARRWQRCKILPRGGRPGCSWPRCRCGGGLTRSV